MRVGVIGVGRQGCRRLRALASLGIPDLHAYDPTQTGFDAALHLCAVAHPSLESLLNAGPEVVFVCTPPESHLILARQVHAAWVQGLFIEKPLALSLDGLDDLDAATWYGTVTMVGANLRYSDGFQRMHDYLADEVPSASFFATYYLPEVRPDYKTSYVAGTGVLFDTAWHLVDMALDWFGPAKVVSASTEPATDIGLPEMNGLVRMELRHESGTTSTIMADIAHARKYRLGVRLRWARESITLDHEEAPGEEMFLEETRDFLDCVREQRPSVNPIARAKATLSLLLEAKARCNLRT